MTGPTHRRRLAAAGAALLLAGGGFAAGRAAAKPGGDRAPSATVRQTGIPGPAAVAAALVRRLNDPTLDSSGLAQLLRAVEAPTGPGLLAAFTPGPGFERATGLAADTAAHRPVIAAVVPVATHVVAATGERAQVAVWAVTLVGTRRLGQLVASWSTETLELRRSETGWLLGGYTSTSGPVPTSTQPPSPVEAALASFGVHR